MISLPFDRRLCRPILTLAIAAWTSAASGQVNPPGQAPVIDDLARSASTPPPGGPPPVLGPQQQGGPPGPPDTAPPTIPAGRSGAIVDLRMTHRAFDLGAPAPGQRLPGKVVYRYRPGQYMAVNVAAGIPTAVHLPPCEKIATFWHGDKNAFPVRYKPGSSRFFVDGLDAGLSAGLQVEAESGRLFAFYLRSTPVDSEDLPDVDLVVDDPGCPALGEGQGRPATITVAGTAPAVIGAEDAGVERHGAAFEANRRGPEPAPAGPDDVGEFSRSVPFDPAQVRIGDITIKATQKGAEAIAPAGAWHDTYWTYLDYRKSLDRGRLPVPYLAEGGMDRPVNFRVIGDGILVVEAVAQAITLKSGDLVVCVLNSWRR